MSLSNIKRLKRFKSFTILNIFLIIKVNFCYSNAHNISKLCFKLARNLSCTNILSLSCKIRKNIP